MSAEQSAAADRAAIAAFRAITPSPAARLLSLVVRRRRFGMLDWFGWLWLGAVVLLADYEWCTRRVPPPRWYISQRKRTAMRVALRSVADAGQPIYWRRSRVVHADREKCFVLVQNGLSVGYTPESYRMFAVWSATGRVDDLGDWVFHWGIFPSHAIATYERCRSEGRPWPNGFGEWVRYW